MKQMIKSDLKYDNYFQENLSTLHPQNSNILKNSIIPSKVPKTMQLKCRKMNNITLDDLPVSILSIFSYVNVYFSYIIFRIFRNILEWKNKPIYLEKLIIVDKGALGDVHISANIVMWGGGVRHCWHSNRGEGVKQ